MAAPRKIRDIIRDSLDELEGFGPLGAVASKSRGQHFNAYYLNEEQALLSRPPINVFSTHLWVHTHSLYGSCRWRWIPSGPPTLPQRSPMVPFTSPPGLLPVAANDNTRTRTPLAYLSACCPSGWNTVWGFIATTNPALIDLMDPVPGVVSPDEAWLDEACEMAGVGVITVPACLWLQSHGITESKAYPIDLLAQHLG